MWLFVCIISKNEHIGLHRKRQSLERVLIMKHIGEHMAIGMCHRCGKERVFRVDDGKRRKSVDGFKKIIYIYKETMYACMACGTTEYKHTIITSYPMDWSVS